MTGCSMMTQTQNNFGAFWPKSLSDHFLLQGAELFAMVEGDFFLAQVYVPTAACIFINQKHASWILVVACQVYHFLFSAFIFGKCCPDAALTRSLSLRNFWCKAPEECRERESAAISFGAHRLLRFAADLHRKLQQNNFFIALCTACILSCIFSLCTRISNDARLRFETAQTASRDACVGCLPAGRTPARRPYP